MFLKRIREKRFVFKELVKRDFKQKYKRTVLGMFWSVLSPLMHLLVMALVFTRFFGRNTPHYIIYVFSGNIIYSYFADSTRQGMNSLMGNAGIITKINVPKSIFLLSKNVSTLINFGITLVIYFVFCIIDKVPFHWDFLLLIYPIVCLIFFNIGVGMVLSAWFVFFRDINYLWSIFTQLLMYMSAIFYRIDNYPRAARLFLINPVYCYINYFRTIVLYNQIPSVQFHLLCAFYAVVVMLVGIAVYRRYNHRFLYYM